MGNSLFKLTSLNLNGIRSASSKGVEAWIAKNQPDCICMQEVKAQEADISGRFEEMAGLKGHFHFAEKKGYSGVAVYTKHAPSDVIVGYGSGEFDAEGLTHPNASYPSSAATSPAARPARSVRPPSSASWMSLTRTWSS
jgi:exodeoxyribonuclease-3